MIINALSNQLEKHLASQVAYHKQINRLKDGLRAWAIAHEHKITAIVLMFGRINGDNIDLNLSIFQEKDFYYANRENDDNDEFIVDLDIELAQNPSLDLLRISIWSSAEVFDAEEFNKERSEIIWTKGEKNDSQAGSVHDS